jgi:hypothetical protein
MMARLVQGARRPVILAGRGAVCSDAGDVLEQLGARIGALLATSVKSLPSGSCWRLLNAIGKALAGRGRPDYRFRCQSEAMDGAS